MECRVNNVALHPLVKQKLIPKRLADVFVYTPPPNKSKTKSKVVKKARFVTSEEVKTEILEMEIIKDNDDILYNADFFKTCDMKDLFDFEFDGGDRDTIGEECIFFALPEPGLVEKQDYIYYKFDYDHNISLL